MVRAGGLPREVHVTVEGVLTAVSIPTSAQFPTAVGEDNAVVLPRLSVMNVSKNFGRNHALRQVSLHVRPGEVHGLIGQNGCGKSTLAKVLTGYHAPSAGARIEVDGTPLRLPVRLQEARARGVAVVHQNLGLVDDQTGLENMRVGRTRPGQFSRRIDWRRERDQVEPVLVRLGRQVPLDVAVRHLSDEDRATLAIARAVQDAKDGGGLIIFDESTRSLSRRTMEHFYELVDDIVASGTSVLLISHGLEEVLQAADRVTVMRDGEVVEAGVETTGLDEAALARMVLGRSLHSSTAARSGGDVGQQTALVAVSGLTGDLVRGVDLTINAGEVLGVTGLPDGGYGELPYLLAGASRARAGTLIWQDGASPVDLPSLSVESAIAQGIVLLPEGRERAGLALEMSVAENIALPQIRGGARAGLPIDRTLTRNSVALWIDRLEVRPAAPQMLAGKLSGGNQQKVMLAKWLATGPRLLLLHEPTQAVDVGARQTLIAAIHAAADAGCAVLVAGADENELALLCDRILILGEGHITDELTGLLDPDDIVHRTFATSARKALRPSRAAGAQPTVPARAESGDQGHPITARTAQERHEPTAGSNR